MKHIYADVALSLLLVLTACASVMNRRFISHHDFYRVNERWLVGEPDIVALDHSANRSYWESQNFRICIPFSLSADEHDISKTGRALDSNQIWVDSVDVLFLSSGNIHRRGPAWSASGAKPVRAVFGIQLYRGMKGAACLMMDTITIPAEEDSIKVSFRVEGPGVADADSTEYSFKLYRKEGKKLVLNMK